MAGGWAWVMESSSRVGCGASARLGAAGTTTGNSFEPMNRALSGASDAGLISGAGGVILRADPCALRPSL
ncbi:hypothetical protein GCM10009595_03620 [Falsarthrobacter nasiphocae]